jgi:DNA-binding response OmpR family regulator
MSSSRVVMLDDSDLALEVQVMMLERKGFEVRGCLDLEELVAVAEDGFVPDAVITDVGLGDTTVEEACACIRKSFGENVPILLFSGREDDELAELVQALDVDGSINKSDNQQLVVEKLEAAIRLAKL